MPNYADRLHRGKCLVIGCNRLWVILGSTRFGDRITYCAECWGSSRYMSAFSDSDQPVYELIFDED